MSPSSQVPEDPWHRSWNKWGTSSYVCLPHVTEDSRKYAASIALRPDDVVIITYPKTGTTFVQAICQLIKTGGDGENGYDGFDEISEVQPWLDFMYDIQQPIPCTNSPRFFKSHQLPSAINTGAKYLSVVRDPASALASWFHFSKTRKRPEFASVDNVNDSFSGECSKFYIHPTKLFGCSIWEFYIELWEIRNEPGVMILVYEHLVKEKRQYLPRIAEFVQRTDQSTPPLSSSALDRVDRLTDRDIMLKHVDKFDDNFIHHRGKGRLLREFYKANKVVPVGKKQELTAASRKWLDEQWKVRVTPFTGHASYASFASDLYGMVM